MEHEAIIRLGIFVGLFGLLALAESYLPRRARSVPRSARWTTNWGIVILDTLTLRLLAVAMPLLAIGAALDAGQRDWGLFNQLAWPLWLEAVLAVLILDFLIWFQHVVTHRVPLLWRFHQVHHADPDMDVTTAIRFHPVEIAVSMLL
ncbi:MAG: sterol desaturase family protein, partial [Pseudomonadota bacterium]